MLGLYPVQQSVFLFYNERFTVPIVYHFEIGNRENIVTFEDMFSVTFAHLEAKKVKKENRTTAKKYLYRVCLYKQKE